MDLKSDKAKKLTKDEVFREIRDYLTEQIELSRRKSIDEDSFDKPSWATYQAYQLGIQKAFTKLHNLLPDQGENNG